VRYRSSLVLMLLAAAMALASAPAAFAQNEIAYGCDLDICLMDPANPSAVQNLTDNGGTSIDKTPIWSPDGAKVAFVSNFTSTGAGEWNVFVMDTTATGDAINLATQITRYPHTESKGIEDLAWSPDGSRIAYTRGNNAGDDKVWVVNADGTTTFPLEIGGEGAKRHPTWSPDSSKIAYAVVKNKPEQIYVASSAGGIGPPLTNGVGHEPLWSPDGSRIAFDAYHSGGFGYVDLHIVNPDGSGTPLIVPPSLYTEWTFSAWAPDGGRIAYRSTANTGATVYRVMNADGSGDHPLASPGAESDGRYATWSPDGSRIVYEGALFSEILARNLYIVNADGSGAAVPLTSDGKARNPAWRVVTAAPPGQVPGPGQHAQLPPPHPGAEKPKIVWITKRIFVGGGRPVEMMKVFCGAPDCGANSHATARASRAAGLPFRPALAKPGKKAKQIVIGTGKLHLREGQKKPLFLHLNKAGWAMLEKQGKLTIHATVTIKSAGVPTVTSKKTLHLVFVKKKKKH
jgi:Tol biopolymer transport system component